MKVVKLVAENVKGLKAVEIIPDETLQIISGANGQGKSSVMDSIWLALAGSVAAKGSNTTRPVRDGADGAVSQVDLGDIIVTRKWNGQGKSTLKVESKEGAVFKSPQSMLDELIGKLSFDPLSFSNLDDKKQLETLMTMVELPVDPAEFDTKKKELFEERTIVNREVKTLKSQIEAATYHEGVPKEEVQASSVMKEMQETQMIINANNEKRQRYKSLGDSYSSLKVKSESQSEEIKRLELELERTKEIYKETLTTMDEVVKEGQALEVVVKNLVDPDLSIYETKISEVELTNAKVRANAKFNEINELFQAKSSQSDNLTNLIQKIEEEKQEIIKNAKFPIDGLSFNEDGVLYNGVPFKQCSSAERLRVSMAMAMSLNPKLKVIRIMDGSLLDKNSLKMIEEMAADKDYQVWIEVVDETGSVGVMIQEGEVVRVND